MLDEISKLDRKGLLKIKAAINLLLPDAITDDIPAHADERTVHEAIERILSRRTSYDTQVASMKKGGTYAAFQEGVEVVRAFVDKNAGAQNKMERTSAIIQMVKLVEQYVAANHRGESNYKTICANLRYLPSAVDRFFPEYELNGMIPYLFSFAKTV